MTTFILILILLDSAMFGAPAKPRLRRVGTHASSVQRSAPTPPPPCIDPGNGEPVCYPTDDSGKTYR